MKVLAALLLISAPAFAYQAEEHEHSAEEHAKHSKPVSQADLEGDMHDHDATHSMTGLLGGYAASREASGTSWQPEAAPHDGIHGMLGEWMTMTHGFVNFIYDNQGGPRGDTKTFATSMLMTSAQRSLGGGDTLGLRGMFSLDPAWGKGGYPLLLQTGETADGKTPLVDRQHPHDLFMELAATYSRRLSDTSSVFGYFGLPGEPALGPPTFMHRFSGEDNPEAPITHHWLDSTHITYGVATLGYVRGPFKIEGSAFRGREPDQNRTNIETGRLDSASMRLSWNPTAAWALQVSHGYLHSPEQLHPDENLHRTTASAIYQRDFGSARWQTTAAWGRNASNHGVSTDAWLLESAISFSRTHTFFARAERADKTDLLPSEEKFTVGKLSAGYVYDLAIHKHVKAGVGGLVSGYSLPGGLEPSYGASPTSYMLFARLKIQ